MVIVQICVFSLFFAVMGFLLRKKKAYWLIAGYNTMSPEEKAKYNEKYDIEKIAKYLGLLLYYIAITVPIVVYLDMYLLNSRLMQLILTGIYILSIGGFLCFIAIKLLDKDSKHMIIFLCGITLVVCLFAGISVL